MNCGGDHSRCYVHPSLHLVGVCPLCLNDRLVFLAAARRSRCGLLRLFSSRARGRSSRGGSMKKSVIGKVLAIGSLVSHRNWSADVLELEGSGDATSSLEDDSFISIKFEEDGQAMWEKSKLSMISLGSSCSSIPWNGQIDVLGKTPHPVKDLKTMGADIVLKHPKRRWPSTLTRRKRIGHLFHLIRRHGNA
ncbi:hypothetical protein SAY86_031774 [Trapa natans]|uniref:Uncharacterized protein n=1 Tax=Trapa natans TaxID=22666 RepID=A0AAN7M7N3_TRANT|nr:hypothetical protein SAY86_031774 [Trapa natans]